jgi:hypothetical protein
MKPVKLQLPAGCEVYNFLYRTRDPQYLVQDQLSVALPNGFFIDVTWAPEHHPTGEYFIRVFYQYWQNQRVQPIRTSSIDDVVASVQDLARYFSQDQILTSSSDAQTAEYVLEHA